MDERATTQVGRNIRDIRIRKGITQRVLADRTHYEFNYIQAIESGHSDVTLVRAYKFAIALGCPVGDLFREPVN
ncbi:MAG TPA: helix-turn-helix transcriptional regulator [bacterium]|nr:helix-turn-helix transcriptional regulator [bacterium]